MDKKQKAYCKDYDELRDALDGSQSALVAIPEPTDGGGIDDPGAPPDVGGSYPGGSLDGMLIDTGVYLYHTAPGHEDLAEWQASAEFPGGDYSILRPVGRVFVLHIASERIAERSLDFNSEYSQEAQALWIDTEEGGYGDTEVVLGWNANDASGNDLAYKLGQAAAWMALARAALDEATGSDNSATREAISFARDKMDALRTAFTDNVKKWPEH